MIPNPIVSVIIPTTADRSRFSHIQRCIGSIRASSIQDIKIIVVVNGTRFDETVCRWLKDQPDVQFEYVTTPSAPNAVCYGRKKVQTRYFSTLDDDDEYIPLTTDLKVQILDSNLADDLVVGNSYRSVSGERSIHYSYLEHVPEDPLAELFRQTWLNSGNALFRTSAIEESLFEDSLPFAEWTWLAFKIAVSGKKVASITIPCHQINVTPNSLSESEEYISSYVELFDRMLETYPSRSIVKLINRRKSAYWHANSRQALARLELKRAAVCHLKSFLFSGGLRYLSYSRHIVKAFIFALPYAYIRRHLVRV